MLKKHPISIIGFAFLVLFASCGGNGKKQEINKADTTTVKTPAELTELNTQLLANPDNSDLLNKRAKYYFKKNDFNSSMTDISKALKIDSTKSDYYITLSNIYFITNQTGKSKAALEKSIKLNDKNIDAILKLAELYLYVKKNKESIEYINKALMIDKFNAKGYFMKGMNFKEMHDTAKAISSMQTAVEQDQKYYNAYIQLGLLCAAKHNPLASQYYKNALQINPKSTEAYYDLGKYYQDEAKWDNALETYSTLLKVNPQYKYACYNMGVIYFSALKKYPEAVEHYTQAITIEPKYVEAYFARGLCYQAMGNKKKAKDDYNSCFALVPDYEPAIAALKELK